MCVVACTATTTIIRDRPERNGIRLDVLTGDTANETKSYGDNRERHNPVDIFGKEDLTTAILSLVCLVDDIPGQV